MADETALLRALAGRIAALAVEHARPRAILLTGSVARGDADAFSDVDLILYHDGLPGETAREAIRTARGGDDLRELGATETGVVEQYVVEGTYCQLAHVTIVGWEHELDLAVAGEESELPLGKMVSGLFDGEALHGGELVDEWRSRAVFSDALRRTLVERSWSFFPLWYFERSFPPRDAPVFTREELVKAAYALLEVLAAVNGVWFSRFQLKRTREATDEDRPGSTSGCSSSSPARWTRRSSSSSRSSARPASSSPSTFPTRRSRSPLPSAPARSHATERRRPKGPSPSSWRFAPSL